MEKYDFSTDKASTTRACIDSFPRTNLSRFISITPSTYQIVLYYQLEICLFHKRIVRFILNRVRFFTGGVRAETSLPSSASSEGDGAWTAAGRNIRGGSR